MTKESNIWKTIGIVFIVLFLLETIAFSYILLLGGRMMGKENTCAINICDGEAYDAYFYDAYTGICSCFQDNKAIYDRYIG